MDKTELIKLVKEKEKRNLLEEYSQDFTRFAQEQIRIVTKDSSKGFVPFELNQAQTLITEQLTKQLEETGRVRAIILKARQQGISTYCVGRVYWKSYFSPHSRSVVMAHDSATSDALFSMSKNLIRNMPKELAPKEERSNAKEVIISSPYFKDKEAKAATVFILLVHLRLVEVLLQQSHTYPRLPSGTTMRRYLQVCSKVSHRPMVPR